MCIMLQHWEAEQMTASSWSHSGQEAATLHKDALAVPPSGLQQSLVGGQLCANQAVHQPSWGVTTRNGRKSPILGGQKRHPPKRQSFLSVVICRGNGTRHSIVHNMWSTWVCKPSLSKNTIANILQTFNLNLTNHPKAKGGGGVV